MYKQILLYPFNGLIFNISKLQITDTCNNIMNLKSIMSEKKSGTKKDVCMIPVTRHSRKHKNILTEMHISDCQGLAVERGI